MDEDDLRFLIQPHRPEFSSDRLESLNAKKLRYTALIHTHTVLRGRSLPSLLINPLTGQEAQYLRILVVIFRQIMEIRGIWL